MATPFLLCRVIESQGQDAEISFIKGQVQAVQVTKAGPSTQMVVFGIGAGLWFLNLPI